MSEAVARTAGHAVRDYMELSRVRVVTMILVTTGAGFVVAQPARVDLVALVLVVIGTGLVAAGTNALNQYLELDYDKLMQRTRTRPLPAGRIEPGEALLFSIGAITVGVAWLALLVNVISAFLALVTTAIYILAYTPLKRRTSLSTIVGAVPGAIPPMIGWAGATGSLEPGAWALFLLMAIWQLPHFLAIGYMFREDYERGGFRMLSLHDEDGRKTALNAALYALILPPLGLVLPVAGVGGYLAGIGSFLAAIYFLVAAWKFLRVRTRTMARSLFMASNIYLLIVMTLVVAGSFF